MNKPTAKKNNLVTKTYLKQELTGLEKRLTNKFVTKEDLKKFALKEDLAILEMRVALKFDDFASRIDENAQKYRDQILNSNDKVVKVIRW